MFLCVCFFRRDGTYHGQGIYQYCNGDSYEGEWKNNKKDGKGVYCYNNGDRYEGEYSEGRKNGHGKFVYSNGDIFEGQYLKSKRDGRGSYIFHDGDKLEGTYRNDAKHGTFIWTFADGRRRQEEWRDNNKVSSTTIPSDFPFFSSLSFFLLLTFPPNLLHFSVKLPFFLIDSGTDSISPPQALREDEVVECCGGFRFCRP